MCACVCVCVWVCGCGCVCMHACVCACMRTCMRVCDILSHSTSSSGSKYLMLTDSESMAPPPKRMRSSMDASPSPFTYSDIPSYDSQSVRQGDEG